MLNIIANIVLFLNDLISASLSNFAVSALSPLFAPYPEFSTAFIMSATFALSGNTQQLLSALQDLPLLLYPAKLSCCRINNIHAML